VEQNYSATERECLAVREAVKMFRPYLYGNKFTISTDHKTLIWLDKHKDERSKLMKWSIELQEYDYEIIYKPGRENTNVDALSRLPTTNAQVATADFEMNLINKKELVADQLRDPLFKNLILYLTKRELPDEEKSIKEIITLSQYFEVDNQVLYHIWVPQEGRQKEDIRRQVALPLD
jgi:hypothetical protein